MPPERPRSQGRRGASSNLLHVELLQEKAANLGRLARKLERALAALREYDEAAGRNPPAPSRRRELLADAGDALFSYVVQREVLGLRGTAQALDELRVPPEVRLCMAPRSVLLAR